ncbi:porin [Flavobacterium hydatis]|uniref:Porin n=1 Tax=Flavobacterium hydatis TaxID=991 RepID=A0A086AE58_FLAHY|nr:porin [Flavobacterium hydatis]KFF14972.1 porin [Flavobacterium hydatis]OXA94025.1 porin [Flavobacterium hydatis]
MNLLNNFLSKKVVLLIFLIPFLSYGQTNIDTIKIKKQEVKYPQFKFGGLLQVRYLGSATNDVDVLGVQDARGDVTKSSFDIKRMRVGLTTKIDENLEAVILVNLADFKSDPKNKVLENAYAKYTFNKYLVFIAGQFRPSFGIEESIPVDIIKSFDFSNQYYEFGRNGWTSFQIGASMIGEVDLGKVPVKYAISILNGNGRNQEKDKDDGKLYSSRVVFGLSKEYDINLGFSAGTGKVFTSDVFALGADITVDFKLADKLTLDSQFELKQGTNHSLYYSLPLESRTGNADDYQMRGFYFLPNLRYDINYKKLISLEFSCRYEYFDSSFKLNSNVRQTYTPMVSLELGKAYRSRVEMGFEINRYDRNILNTEYCNKDLFIIQFQCRL